MFPRGGITAVRYRDEVLEPIARPYAVALGDTFILMQDNARAHTARVSMTFLDDEGVPVMNWPARTPDLNPIEHAWDMLSKHRTTTSTRKCAETYRCPCSGMAGHTPE